MSRPAVSLAALLEAGPENVEALANRLAALGDRPTKEVLMALRALLARVAGALDEGADEATWLALGEAAEALEEGMTLRPPEEGSQEDGPSDAGPSDGVRLHDGARDEAADTVEDSPPTITAVVPGAGGGELPAEVLAAVSAGIPPLTVPHYAALCATCRAFPERLAKTYAKFGIGDDASRRELDEAFERTFQRDPRVRVLWRLLVEQFERWLAQYGRV